MKASTDKALAILAGAMATLGFAPYEFWPLAILSCLGLLVALQTAITPKQAAWRGWFYGVGFFGTGVSWVYVSINQFGNAPVILAAFLTASFVCAIALLFALHGYLYKRWVADKSLFIAIGFPAIWVLAEAFRGWFLTGFPWLYLGYAPIDSWLAGWAPVTGVLGLSGFSALAASCLYLIPRVSMRLKLALLSLALAPFISGKLLQQVQWTEPTSQPPLKVALVQANIPQELKWSSAHRARIIDQYLSLSQPLIEPSMTNEAANAMAKESTTTELIIWPETAIPLLYDSALKNLASFDKYLLSNQTGLISGVPYRSPKEPESPTIYHNSIMGLGNAQGLYHKQRLVPFGEYVPLETWLRGLIDFFNLPMSNFSLGPTDQLPLQFTRALNRSGNSDENPKIAISAYICYEIVYPDLVANSAGDSQLLLTISNDSWFGDSLAPHQHLQMARMRALETGRYLIRSTNNGISALIDAKGKIITQGPQFTTDIIRGEVLPMQGLSPFVRFGSIPIILLSTVLAGISAFRRRAATSLGPKSPKRFETSKGR